MLRVLVFNIFLFMVGNEEAAFCQSAPTRIEFEVLKVENRTENDGNEVESERFSAGRVGVNQSFIQAFGNKTYTQSIIGGSGRAFSEDRTFSNLGLNLTYVALYHTGQLSVSLTGNWGKGQDVTQSLTLEDTLLVEDPNELEYRFLLGNATYSHNLSALSNYSLSASIQTLDTYNQDVETKTVSASLLRVLSVRSSLRSTIQYGIQKPLNSSESSTALWGLNYSYRLSERGIVAIQGGQTRSETEGDTLTFGTGGASYTYLFYRNRVLQSLETTKHDDDNILSSSPDSLSEQVSSQSFANSFRVEWNRSFTSTEEGSASSITDTTLVSLSAETSTQSVFQFVVSNADQENNGNIVSENYVRAMNIEFRYRLGLPQEGKPPPSEISISGDYSETKNLESQLAATRRLVTLGYLIQF
ncbi:hypothetical protein [Pseudobacteriovorax antillogorgiicola]|uniref:Uncharacterized protein n=1 Tax=Pseudobacteriovorax antillogorgiicola TaxID=1513793 RepID=A0A1Y6BT24_9BACT|nr:hypothetical protein [Pseudobacteriovorax antillogorgiicola]TCS54542.1 hypothetical protein EDD56_10655 [Pseudobacteriovorax antillogorgiicola]SMF18583.1 hypothetical protein SAMN06296036_106188 [Pseudobacteriovorax antillogorgiicola]